MVPLFKLFSLIIRLFTRPITNTIKSSIRSRPDHNPITKNILVNMGQKYHALNIRIQRYSMKMSGKDSYVKPLSEEKALEAGVDLFGEIFVYGTLLGIGIYELIKFTKDSRRKEAVYQETLARIHARIDGVEESYSQLIDEIKKLELLLEKVETKQAQTSENTE